MQLTRRTFVKLLGALGLVPATTLEALSKPRALSGVKAGPAAIRTRELLQLGMPYVEFAPLRPDGTYGEFRALGIAENVELGGQSAGVRSIEFRVHTPGPARPGWHKHEIDGAARIRQMMDVGLNATWEVPKARLLMSDDPGAMVTLMDSGGPRPYGTVVVGKVG